MQHRMINNKFTVSLVFSLLAMMVVSIMNVSAAANNTFRQPLSYYSPPSAGASGNPWALPQTPAKAPDFQRPVQQREHRYRGNSGNIQYPGFRFVTPEILESLKQQQMYTQQVPGNYPRRQYRPQQSAPSQLMSEPPVQGYYEMPSTAMGFTNPLYDTPAVSPWGNGSDVIYRGESFPWVPDAAIGGIPPMNVQPFTGNNGLGEVESGTKYHQNKVFNPFAFGQNGNL